ncbi:hypothetical protein BWQ96_00333 [Gracilariopsis chorda]|uniref:Uncharacterized protein n=1 Tax=Gracilariopsis chorda TaxID=448386 RepID=A0A2V3J7G5_9FLOR|nr:hypothetical protein BWQ96_00333 [Gracilariopsis chorda]|eukprot:PXF50173.1 hypothetical protein BWQ96_00333 [Gracilariopsis chorda]
MVRFLRSCFEIIDNKKSLDWFVASEIMLARLHFPIAVCFSIGILAQTGLVPYAAPHEWKFVLIASLFLTLANGRDLNHCIRALFQTEPREEDAVTSLGLTTWNDSGSAGGHMQLLSAFALTLGSVSLLNASIIGIARDSEGSSNICRRQFASSFALFLIGSGANNIPVNKKAQRLECTRILVGFQNILASATLSVASVLMLPGIGGEKTTSSFQLSLTSALSGIGSILLIMSSIVNYFYTVAYCTRQCEYLESFCLAHAHEKAEVGAKRRRLMTWERVKSLFWSGRSNWWKRRKPVVRKRLRRNASNNRIDQYDPGGTRIILSESSEFEMDSSSSLLSRSASSSSYSSFSSLYDEEQGRESSDGSISEHSTPERRGRSAHGRDMPRRAHS